MERKLESDMKETREQQKQNKKMTEKTWQDEKIVKWCLRKQLYPEKGPIKENFLQELY